MNLMIKTRIQLNYREVMSGFTVELFEALKPPLLPLKVERFDGCRTGDEVHLKVGPFRQQWISLITSDFDNDSECGFVDEGKVIPPPLRTWHHTHRIVNLSANECEIQDDIRYSTGLKLLDLLLYPALYLQFAIRPKAYRLYFAKAREA
jgi:ligand-binding SRPBCC domain-containing protein